VEVGACKVVCFHPLHAYRSAGGKIVFNPKGGYVDLPVELACGQCQGCRLERSRQWAIRCVHEAQMHSKNSFITLTYSPEHLPADGGLVLADWQKFAKRLRHKAGPFRFFHCGEYGELNKRPHYHACIFGLDFIADRSLWKDDGRNPLFRSPLLDSCWGLGFASVGALSYKSAAYVARYVMKKATGDLALEEYGRVDEETGEVSFLRPPYVTMSRRPGIGSTWFSKFKSDVFPSDGVVHEGKRFRPPRYYDSLLGADELDEYKVKRRRAVANRGKDLSPDRLRSREIVCEAGLKLFKRRI